MASGTHHLISKGDRQSYAPDDESDLSRQTSDDGFDPKEKEKKKNKERKKERTFASSKGSLSACIKGRMHSGSGTYIGTFLKVGNHYDQGGYQG